VRNGQGPGRATIRGHWGGRRGVVGADGARRAVDLAGVGGLGDAAGEEKGN